ncbi:hypothetical protein Cni_G04301 [Canna indica]|uniref:DUF4378 domain-containing protein n=1 Tax=Canna indica TaxID=4628 RepID=A0AAQ3JV50_9LILI|nr:hypothetical protein Cni_G04301 [Canna indica]
MASLSPSSPRHGRKLAELLQEQQEPFMLKVYLLEKGYSERLIPSCHAATFCWPANACKQLQRLTSNGFRKRKRRRCQLLKCLLAKLLNPIAVRNSLNWDNKVLHFSDAEGSKSDAMDGDKVSCSSVSTLGDLEGVTNPWKLMEVGDDSKQLSPVSVFELRSCEGSPVHITKDDISRLDLDSPAKDVDAFKELLELARSPAFHQFPESRRQLDEPKKLDRLDDQWILNSNECSAHEIPQDMLYNDDDEEEEEEGEMFNECSANEIAEGTINEDEGGEEEEEETTSWHKLQKGVLSSISQLTLSDISKAKRDWYEFQPQVEEIGIHIEEALLQETIEHVILEMLGFHCTSFLREVN